MASAPSVASQAPSSDNSYRTSIEAFGIKLDIPLPKWAIICLAVLVIASAAGGGIYWLVTKFSHTELVSKSQMDVYEESTFHSGEPDEFKLSHKDTFDTTTVTIRYFKSDGCVQIFRWDATRAKGDGLWMYGPHPHIGEPDDHAVASSFRQADLQPRAEAANLKLISDELTTNDYGERPHRAHLLRVQGGSCRNPHPGPFSARNEPINQCLVRVWRTFSDGCVHYQNFNPCAGTWDVNADGSPRVVWTHCVH